MSSDFSGLGLPEPLLAALAAAGHTTPTPIQAQAIPALLKGADLLGIAQTGTGKTGAFTLPMLAKLLASNERTVSRAPRALILTPTRELAQQVAEAIKLYALRTKLRWGVVVGGVNQHPQTRALSRGIDILIATPGRLLDLVDQGHCMLDRVSTLVLDEADRMLDMGFQKPIRDIAELVGRDRQTLLFSATMPKTVEQLANAMLRDPVRVEIKGETVAVERVEQRVHFVEQTEKRAKIVELLADPAMERVILFTRTKHGADRVAEHLRRAAVQAACIHGNKTQAQRNDALGRFRDGRARVLVATDVAARGIDVPLVSHVVNFDLPNEAETYVHRIGRTARAGEAGIALSFCSGEERPFLRDIERFTRQDLGGGGLTERRPHGSAPGGAGRKPGRGGRPRHASAGRTGQSGRRPNAA